jgi:hypothetical protein
VVLKRILGAAVALTCVVLLSSCSLLPKLPTPAGGDDPNQTSSAVMQQIAGAVKDHDAAALKKLFSPAARKNATDFNGGVDYFLSYFPSGQMTWKLMSVATDGVNNYPQVTEGVYPSYEISSGGKKYDLFFAGFPANAIDPENVGIYALGVTPHSSSPFDASGELKPFYAWSRAFHNGNYKDPSTPGVYVPRKSA